MLNCKPEDTPHQPGLYLSAQMCPADEAEREDMKSIPYCRLVGSLNYIATMTRPDICYAVNALCQFMKNPGQAHWKAAKRVLRYLKGTATYGPKFSFNEKAPVSYCDSDFAGDPDKHRSTSGIVCLMANGTLIWRSQRQKVTAESSVEAEYMALSLASREIK